ncbi:hypothetical protein BKA67DRAFT_592019 [Truncatella angustata]|uniref:Uncharacterized protein n=1 Tax=Truncatella angustata TaxID=152316 RepID=A0A9P8UP48_9PEZI|nr:uncharacterized protein BKA67DRAFT_592019 [Truncatella angustata]KAH6655861.1 hypothetical protein BKA67DRAFT_592019 [Truncatella angustata]KAH8202940.1 hypothetical protein TruAng_002886 [Truncatella angustata]
MGVDSKKAPPLPAPTETESLSTPTELATDLSHWQEEEKSHISIPDDGTPVTIRTRGHKHNRSQTSLLIEYFEGGKGPVSTDGGAINTRKPSVRVRLTPSKGGRGKNDHIQITEMSKSSRKVSASKRDKQDPLVPSQLSELDMSEDARSLHSYASATEESNVSRNPIEVDIQPGHYRRRERKPSSPLIPAADSKLSSSYLPPNMSDISGIPTDSFLDGSGGTHLSYSPKRHSKNPSAAEALAAGTLGAVAAAAVADKANRKNRSASHDRKIIERAVEKATRPDKKHRSKSRTSSISEMEVDGKSSSRRRSSKSGHKESLVSGADSSMVSSALTPSHRSYDSYSSSKVSLNNPKLLETVEDAIRRLILPELESLKRERSQRDTRSGSMRSRDRASLSSLTTDSRDELSVTSKRKSGATEHSIRSRGREARNDLSPQSSVEHVSVLEHEENTPRRDNHVGDVALLGAAAAAGIAAANRDRSRADEKRQRRRRRAKTPEHGRAGEEYDEYEQEVAPPMPLSSEINPSEMTRTSILSADTDRPHSASDEITPIRDVTRDVISNGSVHDSLTPTQTPDHHSLQKLGALHANLSHGDLKNLPRKSTGGYEYEEESELSSNNPAYRDEYDEYEEEGLSEPAMYENTFYNQQDVPPPLRYVPYQQERRGLSPIQSVSGYTEGESDLYHRRDSRLTDSEISSPRKSPHPSSVPSNMRSREFGDEESSVRSSGNYRDTRYTDDSELDQVTSGQAVRGVGANPQFIHQPFGAESNVASLVEGSALDSSVLSNGQEYRDSQLSRDSEISAGPDYRDSQLSYDSRAEEHLSRGSGAGSPSKNSVSSRVEQFEKRNSPALSKQSLSQASREFEEYELDQYGRKYPKTETRHSPTTSEQAITNAALSRAAEAAKMKAQQAALSSEEQQWEGEGVARNKSFKERAKADGFRSDATPRHSIDRLSEQYELGASGLPDSDYPMPEIGYGYQHSENGHSVVEGPLGGSETHEWHEERTPTQEKTFDFDRTTTPKAGQKGSSHSLGLTEAVAAGALATAAGMAASHSRHASQDQDEEWHRTSMDRKRDTLVTNPYEGTSPIANLPGLDQLTGAGFHGGEQYRAGFNTGSPGMGGDEGYETAQPNEANMQGKAVAFQSQPGMGGNTEDPFYVGMPKHQRQISGLSHGMGSPLYDAATGAGIDNIQSKDIIALMEHLMVRDAQRSARDTEMLVTLVRSAAEMRTSFNDIKRLLADTEDQIIGEVKDNTEKTVQRHVGGPRPFPGSGARSLQGGSQSGTFDENAKKRNIFRRALKGLSSKGDKDLGRIEDMLMHLLGEVDVLKHQTAGQGPVSGMGTRSHSFENLPEVQYEQDKGYEPEGLAGTSTASHGSQSGHLSIPQTRGSSANRGYERKFSDHRISTVDEGDEDEYYNEQQVTPRHQNEEFLMSPAIPPARADSVPLATPPQTANMAEHSASYENTPVTDASKKHKSKASSGFFPKISRWSETTTSSVGKMFRNSRKPEQGDQVEEFLRHRPSRSGSDLEHYEVYSPSDPYGEDKLHTGYSEQDLNGNDEFEATTPTSYRQEHPPAMYATPEDPKYKAHRNSVNLQHPQPRPGQTERFRTALETSAQGYDANLQAPMSPRSGDWARSATSLGRFDEQNEQNEYGWTSPSQQAPARPPKEPLEDNAGTPARNARLSNIQKQNSPLPYQSVDSGYGGTATHAGTVGSASFHSGSPKPENRNLNGALGAPARRPSGPRAMTPSRGLNRSRGSDDGDSIRSGRSGISDTHARDERRRKRDTFGTVGTVASQESETF